MDDYDNAPPTDNLEAAIFFAQAAHGKLRALTAAHPGDQLYYDAESRLAGISLSLIGRRNHARAIPPASSPADAAFYGR